MQQDFAKYFLLSISFEVIDTFKKLTKKQDSYYYVAYQIVNYKSTLETNSKVANKIKNQFSIYENRAFEIFKIFLNVKLLQVKPMAFSLQSEYNLIALKGYISYDYANTPFPPLHKVPKKGFSL